MDSFFEDPKPKCCDPFPGTNLKFCWEVDSNYCSTCGRWLEYPSDAERVHIKRMERHSRECPNDRCVPQPKFCLCGHSNVEHHKCLPCNNLSGKSDEEIIQAFHRMMKGQHNCESCDCSAWRPNYDGYCD